MSGNEPTWRTFREWGSEDDHRSFDETEADGTRHEDPGGPKRFGKVGRAGWSELPADLVSGPTWWSVSYVRRVLALRTSRVE